MSAPVKLIRRLTFVALAMLIAGGIIAPFVQVNRLAGRIKVALQNSLHRRVDIGQAERLAETAAAALALQHHHLAVRQPGPGIGAVLPTVQLRGVAADRRRDFRHVVSSFLDLVAMNLAGGRGVPEARRREWVRRRRYSITAVRHFSTR